MAYIPKNEILVTKTFTYNHTMGDSDVSVFIQTGNVQVTEFYAILTRVGNDDTMEDMQWKMGSSVLKISNMDGYLVGGWCLLNGGVDDSNARDNGDTYHVEGYGTFTNNIPPNFATTSDPTTTNYITFMCGTYDSNTDVDFQVYIRYIPLSDGAKIIPYSVS